MYNEIQKLFFFVIDENKMYYYLVFCNVVDMNCVFFKMQMFWSFLFRVVQKFIGKMVFVEINSFIIKIS